MPRGPGRSLEFPDKTVARLPRGSIQRLNAIADRCGVSQGAALRAALAIGMDTLEGLLRGELEPRA